MNIQEFVEEKIEEITFRKVTVEDLLWSENILDSINIIELVVEIENEFGIQIPTSDIVLENFEKLDSIVKYIECKK
jgi:acyl carrier protein